MASLADQDNEEFGRQEIGVTKKQIKKKKDRCSV